VALGESFGAIRLLFSQPARPFPLVNHTTSAYPDGQTKDRQSDRWAAIPAFAVVVLPTGFVPYYCRASRWVSCISGGVCRCVLTFNQRIVPFNFANKAKAQAPKCDSQARAWYFSLPTEVHPSPCPLGRTLGSSGYAPCQLLEAFEERGPRTFVVHFYCQLNAVTAVTVVLPVLSRLSPFSQLFKFSFSTHLADAMFMLSLCALFRESI